jgi:hypothetical protein
MHPYDTALIVIAILLIASVTRAIAEHEQTLDEQTRQIRSLTQTLSSGASTTVGLTQQAITRLKQELGLIGAHTWN